MEREKQSSSFLKERTKELLVFCLGLGSAGNQRRAHAGGNTHAKIQSLSTPGVKFFRRGVTKGFLFGVGFDDAGAPIKIKSFLLLFFKKAVLNLSCDLEGYSHGV
jgi:hypothetical protein